MCFKVYTNSNSSLFDLGQPTQEAEGSFSDEAIAKELQMDEDMEVGSGHTAHVPVLIRIWSYQNCMLLYSVIRDLNKNYRVEL